MSNHRAADEAAIQAVLADSYKAWEAGDADAMVADYTADATAIMTGSLRDSREVIRQSMALAFAGPLDLQQTAQRPLHRRGCRDRHQRIRHPVRRRDRSSRRRAQGERDVGLREARPAVAHRRLSQQPGTRACPVSRG
ncbi:YybH family protein [Nocardia beijingensis]|uniref:YybH family protein n=1 Tax=Nocardia beijingensis TaxID=95162 RepID=UPI003F4CA5C7